MSENKDPWSEIERDMQDSHISVGEIEGCLNHWKNKYLLLPILKEEAIRPEIETINFISEAVTGNDGYPAIIRKIKDYANKIYNDLIGRIASLTKERDILIGNDARQQEQIEKWEKAYDDLAKIVSDKNIEIVTLKNAEKHNASLIEQLKEQLKDKWAHFKENNPLE